MENGVDLCIYVFCVDLGSLHEESKDFLLISIFHILIEACFFSVLAVTTTTTTLMES